MTVAYSGGGNVKERLSTGWSLFGLCLYPHPTCQLDLFSVPLYNHAQRVESCLTYGLGLSLALPRLQPDL